MNEDKNVRLFLNQLVFWKLEKPSFWNLPWTRNTSRQREKHF